MKFDTNKNVTFFEILKYIEGHKKRGQPIYYDLLSGNRAVIYHLSAEQIADNVDMFRRLDPFFIVNRLYHDKYNIYFCNIEVSDAC